MHVDTKRHHCRADAPLATLVCLEAAGAEAAMLWLASQLAGRRCGGGDSPLDADASQQAPSAQRQQADAASLELLSAIAGAARVAFAAFPTASEGQQPGAPVAGGAAALDELVQACAAASSCTSGRGCGEGPPAAGAAAGHGWAAARASSPARNPLAEQLAQQLAAARSEADGLHAHYLGLLEKVAGPSWRVDLAAIERPPAEAPPQTRKGVQQGSSTGALACLAAVGGSTQPPSQQQQQQRPAQQEQAGRARPPAVALPSDEAAAPQPQSPPSPSRARQALAGAAAAIQTRALEAQKASLESQLEGARRAQRMAEYRVSTVGCSSGS